jgi:hypothetical protein
MMTVTLTIHTHKTSEQVESEVLWSTYPDAGIDNFNVDDSLVIITEDGETLLAHVWNVDIETGRIWVELD